MTEESELHYQLEDIKKVEATIAALDKRMVEVCRENRNLDYELNRQNPNGNFANSNIPKV